MGQMLGGLGGLLGPSQANTGGSRGGGGGPPIPGVPDTGWGDDPSAQDFLSSIDPSNAAVLGFAGSQDQNAPPDAGPESVPASPTPAMNAPTKPWPQDGGDTAAAGPSIMQRIEEEFAAAGDTSRHTPAGPHFFEPTGGNQQIPQALGQQGQRLQQLADPGGNPQPGAGSGFNPLDNPAFQNPPQPRGAPNDRIPATGLPPPETPPAPEQIPIPQPRPETAGPSAPVREEPPAPAPPSIMRPEAATHFLPELFKFLYPGGNTTIGRSVGDLAGQVIPPHGPQPYRTPAPGAAQQGYGPAYNQNIDFLKQRGGYDQRMSNEPGALTPEFANRMATAAKAYEAETGKRAEFGQMFRDKASQAAYRAEYERTGQGLAARPGHSQHEFGQATDVPEGEFRNWLHQHAGQYGLAFLRPGHGYEQDRAHVQMGGGARQTASAEAAPASPTTASYNPGTYYNATVGIESGGNPGTRTGSNLGLLQFGPEEERRYGINAGNRNDPATLQRALQQEVREHTPGLRRVLGRDPQPWELYLSHQQGIAGGPALLAAAQQNPDMPAWQVLRRFKSERLAKDSIWKNMYPRTRANENMTVGQFVDWWHGRFDRELGRPRGSQYASR